MVGTHEHAAVCGNDQPVDVGVGQAIAFIVKAVLSGVFVVGEQPLFGGNPKNLFGRVLPYGVDIVILKTVESLFPAFFFYFETIQPIEVRTQPQRAFVVEKSGEDILIGKMRYPFKSAFFGIENPHAQLGTQKQAVVGEFKDIAGIDASAALALEEKRFKLLLFTVEQHQTAVGTHPHALMAVAENRFQNVVLVGEVSLLDQAFLPVEDIQPTLGTDPNATPPVFSQATYRLVAQTASGLGGTLPEIPEHGGIRHDFNQSIGITIGPDDARIVGVHAVKFVILEV